MPNYVHNIIKIRSQKDDAEEIIQFIQQHFNKEGFFDFNTIIPEPTTEEECPDRYNFNTEEGSAYDTSLEIEEGTEWFNWYNWRLEYWGTKWNAGAESMCYYDFDQIRKNYSFESPVQIMFETAWSAPIPVFVELISMHPELDIDVLYYSTENCEFGHVFVWDDEIIHIHDDFTNVTEEKFTIKEKKGRKQEMIEAPVTSGTLKKTTTEQKLRILQAHREYLKMEEQKSKDAGLWIPDNQLNNRKNIRKK